MELTKKRLRFKIQKKTYVVDYDETWNNWSDMFCPDCGYQGAIWYSTGQDYYEGADHICIVCGFRFTMPSMDHIKDNGSGDSMSYRILQTLRRS